MKQDDVIKALEICTSIDKTADCPLGCPYGDIDSCEESLMCHALTLIHFYKQKIFELENRLKECENGYEGTLYLDRCKLHDAEEKIKELDKVDEDYVALYAAYAELIRTYTELTEENERLRAEVERLTEGNEWLIKLLDDRCDRCIGRQQAETVREMVEKIKDFYNRPCYQPTKEHPVRHTDVQFMLSVIDQIAQEMLEGK